MTPAAGARCGGCPVGRSCAEGQAELYEFEVAAFPAPGAGPWLAEPETRQVGADAASSKIETADDPLALRPDLPWLADLTLPDLPIKWTKRLIDYLVFYKEDRTGRNIMRGWLEAQGRYQDLILAQLRSRKLPDDLLYVAMIESSYDTFESSYAGAAGLWQFMPAGGKIYGLQIDRWIDERNDPLRSTVAVLDYFGDLYTRFGDWALALAAYNAGYGAVLRSIARYNTNDYYQLGSYENGLAWESTLYVPKALACAIVGHNREVFGFADVKVDPAEAWEEVAVGGSTKLSSLAAATGTSLEAMKRLNPHLRRGRTPPGKAGYVVRIPVGTKASYERKLADLRSEWDGVDAYVVAQGDRVEDIATTFGITAAKLRALNEFEHDSEIVGGMVLVVPKIDAATRERNRERARAALHTSGVDQAADEAMIVPVPDKDADHPGERVFYRVVTGDGLTRVARALGVSVVDLATWNGLAKDAMLHPKMVLQAWLPAGARPKDVQLLDETRILVVTRGSAEHLDLAEERVGRARVEYVAKGRESFEAIGKKFGLGPRDLARINRRASTTVLAPGEKIIVYQAVDRRRSERADEQWRKAPASRRGEPDAAPPAWVARDAGSLPPAAAPSAPEAPTPSEGTGGGDGEPSTPPADDTSVHDGDELDEGPVAAPR
jgi:membrane-bound lytic murein transglycosylase D